MGVNIYVKFGILNLSNLSKISHENEILGESGDGVGVGSTESSPETCSDFRTSMEMN